jgi:L-threonate 2-dehydrogenase
MLQVRGPMMVAGTFDEASVRLEVFSKDIDIITRFAAEHGSPTPLFSVSSIIYRAAVAEGRAAQDAAAVFAVLRELAERKG